MNQRHRLSAAAIVESACSKASSARSLRSEVDTRQPTMRRENTSTTTAT
jgi:hypothetical protein